MSSLFSSLLLTLSAVVGVPSQPPADPAWLVNEEWDISKSNPEFRASSETIATICNSNLDSYLSFPVVLYGAHVISVNGVVIEKFGDPTFANPSFVSSAPAIKCRLLQGHSKVEWRVVAYSPYFARFSNYPIVVKDRPWTEFYGETLYVGGAIGLLVLSLFALTILKGKESDALTRSLTGSILGFATYNFGLVAPDFNLNLSMLTVHKLSDLGLMIGGTLIVYCFYLEGLASRRSFLLVAATAATAVVCILAGSTGDMIQFGTSIPFGPFIWAFLEGLPKQIRSAWRHGSKGESLLYSLCAVAFVGAIINDICVFMGLVNGPTIMSIGMMFSCLTLVLAVSKRIDAAYKERDLLRHNLEKQVIEKTQELRTTLSDLQTTQAELIQSAKLASLGTLSAGIAHEINNSLNYVNGSLPPLEKIVSRTEMPETDKAKAQKLIGVMKEGLKLTFDIIVSLRKYTGLNQAKHNDVVLIEAVKSVLTILHNKTRDKIQIDLAVDETIKVFGNIVGLNQVFMNLIGNAVDAMPQGGRLSISATTEGNSAKIIVEDSGTGIPPEIISRIFDPFFTTKEVGKGTGLGLHIVKKEIASHKGTIDVVSTIGKGTRFVIILPTNGTSGSEMAA